MITTTVDVDIYPKDVLPDISTKDLLEELRTRGKEASDLTAREHVDGLAEIGCPRELLAPIEKWAMGQLSLAELLETIQRR